MKKVQKLNGGFNTPFKLFSKTPLSNCKGMYFKALILKKKRTEQKTTATKF